MDPAFRTFEDAIQKVIPDSPRPLVIYTGLWTLAQSFSTKGEVLVRSLTEFLMNRFQDRPAILMPTYTNGFQDGFLNLDTSPATTGMVNERFRLSSETFRNRSAFFSFAMKGKLAPELAELRPKESWGPGSLFEWIELENAQILLLGVPLQMCSFLHRFEWKAKVPYRYNKSFSGEIFIRGKKENWEEVLFVRSLDPLAENSWEGLERQLGNQLYFKTSFGRGFLIGTDAASLNKVCMDALDRDPFVFTKTPDSLRQFFKKGD